MSKEKPEFTWEYRIVRRKSNLFVIREVCFRKGEFYKIQGTVNDKLNLLPQGLSIVDLKRDFDELICVFDRKVIEERSKE